MTNKNSGNFTTPLQVEKRLAELIIAYCQAENNGEHATGEQILFEIKRLKNLNITEADD